MKQHLVRVKVSTTGRSLVDVTPKVRAAVEASGLRDGLVTVFVRHTSASVVVQENADPDVLGDLARFFARLVPDGDRIFAHDAEGPDDMPAHVRAALTATQVAVPFERGQLLLGTWQAVYLFEHRASPHVRELVLHVLGDLV